MIVETHSNLKRPAYRLVAEQLRRRAERGEYAVGDKLPTEDQLRHTFGVSRHTIRQAIGHLVEVGMVHRVQGSGTYLIGYETNSVRYQRAIGSLDEIMSWPGTTTRLLEPFRRGVSEPAIARDLGADISDVRCALVQRCYNDAPFALTRHYMVSSLADNVIDRAAWETDSTIIQSAERLLPEGIVSATQSIHATRAEETESELIGCSVGDAVLLIERLYHDAGGRPVEFTASRFNPRRYSYRMDLRRHR
ncbi:GntR family transcriptional regulator [Rhodococcus aetherivorans]|uniref:GntR family transcriptional regulator n=1 Tax=Rhodococcus aetherivorans TaxID=191292 RepID=UPI0031D32C39